MSVLSVTSTQAVLFRLAAHCLDERRRPETPLGEVVGVPLPDYPKGAALRGLAARRDGVVGDTVVTALTEGELVRALSLRGTTHVFPASDATAFTGGVLPSPGDERAVRVALGAAWPPFEELGIAAVDALARTRDEIAAVVADGRGHTKGEISEALHGRLPQGWEPWCARCGVHHVPDLLFRLAALAAGLRFADEGAQLVPGPPPDAGEHEVARQELVRRFLHAYAPATPTAFAEWCGIGPSEARASFAVLGDEIVDVRLDGQAARALARDVDQLRDPPPVEGVRLVPAGDAFLQQRDRATLLADPAHRRALWRPAGAPGLVLVDGVPAGVWRHKQTRAGLLVTVDAWTGGLTRLRSAVEGEAALLATTQGIDPGDVRVEITG